MHQTNAQTMYKILSLHTFYKLHLYMESNHLDTLKVYIKFINGPQIIYQENV